MERKMLNENGKMSYWLNIRTSKWSQSHLDRTLKLTVWKNTEDMQTFVMFSVVILKLIFWSLKYIPKLFVHFMIL